jgi:hypothetical protein
MPNISATNINYTSFRGVIGGLAFPADYYSLFEIELWNYNETVYYYTSSWTDSSTVNQYSYIDFSGLNQGTGYVIKGFVRAGAGRTHVGTTNLTTLSPPLPSGVGSVSATPSENSLFISWGNASNVERYALEVRIGNSSGTLVFNTYNLVSTSETVSGLTSATAYHIKVYAINSVGNGAPSETTATTSSPPNPRPSNWSWSTLVSGNSTYTYGGKIRANVVSATEWINFCSRINEFRVYKNLSAYAFTSAITYESLTSSIFNEASYAINQMTTVPNIVSTGEKGVNSKIMALSNALNSIA